MIYNYIILNGIPSWEIPGLIINTLPPITKAPRRADLQNADGMNGDIRTNLGYDAYDRDVEIGIETDKADFEQIFRYLNSDGFAAFSNEPEMIYEYSIDGQIDFEKLIRFNKATVTFRVQPDKQSLLEFMIQKSFAFDKTDNTFSAEMEIINAGNVDKKETLLIVPGYNIPSTSGNLSLKIELYANGETTASGSVTLTTPYRNSTGNYFKFITKTGNVFMKTSVNEYAVNDRIKGDVSALAFKPGINKLKFTSLSDGSYIQSVSTGNYSGWV